MEAKTAELLTDHHYKCGGFEFERKETPQGVVYRCLKCGNETVEQKSEEQKKAA